MTHSDHEEAERLGRQRSRQWPALAAVLISQQALFLSLDETARITRTVDWLKATGWLVLALVVLTALWTGGYWLKRREVRALMDDEVTRAHRADALALAFLVTMLTAMGLYVAALFEPVGLRLAVHIVVTTGLAVALLRFGMLERRAYRG